MSAYIWPRLEVLQLVIPSLGHVNRGLQISIVVDAIRHLHQSVGPFDKMVTFDRWLIIAKTVLKLNDSCIKLFWDMLSMAVLYVEKKVSSTEESISLEYVIIFLLLHVIDPHIRASPSSTSQYDTMWPVAMDIDQISPSSPSSSSSKRIHLSNSPPSSPPAMSPRSAKNLASGPKYSKSSSQHLQTLKRKLPLILTSLAFDMNALEDLKNGKDDFVVDLQTLNLDGTSPSILNSSISSRVLDSLRLILGGGYTYENEVSSISSLHPYFSTLSPRALAEAHLSYSEMISWLENHLGCNEIFYPSGVYNPASPKLSTSIASNKVFFPSPAMTDQAIGSIISPQVIDDYGVQNAPRYIASQTSVQQPQRILNSISSLSKSNASLVHGCHSSTYIHIVSDEVPPATSPSFMHLHSTSTDDDRQDLVSLMEKQDLGVDKMQISSSGGSDMAMSEGELTDISDKDLSLKIPRMIEPFTSTEIIDKISRLPSLSVNNCVKSTIYLISPYSTGNISSCRDCDIIIGPVCGVLVMIGCEKVRLSVACRKLVLHNCVDCEIYIANLSPTVIIGDSRSLSFAPYNVVYRSLKVHLSLAGLDGLTQSQSLDSHSSLAASSASEQIINHWSVLCDVNLCLEAAVTAASPTGYAVDVMREGVIILPTPAPSTASILPLEKFNFVVIPFRNEHAPFERCVIPLPLPHREAFQLRKKKAVVVQRQLQELLSENSLNGLNNLNNSNNSNGSKNIIDSQLEVESKDDKLLESLGAITAISPVLTKKFLEWLMRSGKIHEVVDLIRIDADAVKSMHGSGSGSNGSGIANLSESLNSK